MRRVFRSWIKILLSVITVWVILEILARVLLPPPPEIKVSPSSISTTFELASNPDERGYLGLYMNTPRGYRLRPSTSAIITNHIFSRTTVNLETNSFGFRGPELKRDAFPRILFIGDSITLADSVDDQATFVRQTEALLRRRYPNAETINAGVGASGIRDYLRLIEEAAPIDSDMAVIGLYLNDFKSSPVFFPMELPFLLRRSWAASYFNLLLSMRLRPPDIHKDDSLFLSNLSLLSLQAEQNLNHSDSGASKEIREQILNSIHDWGGSWTSDSWKIISSKMKEIQSVLSRSKTQSLYLLFPVRYQVEENNIVNFPQRAFQSICHTLSLECVDLLPLFREEYRRGTQLFFDHCHLTEAGNEVTAKLIMDTVMKQLK